MNNNFRKFDVIVFKKLHPNKIFDLFNKLPYFESLKLKLNDVSNYIKIRPAIIIRIFKFKYKNPNLDKYLIIPLTTKKSINAWIDGSKLLRTELKHHLFKNINSFLMLDSVMLISKQQIFGLYRILNKPVHLSLAQQKWLKKQIFNKYESILFN